MHRIHDCPRISLVLKMSLFQDIFLQNNMLEEFGKGRNQNIDTFGTILVGKVIYPVPVFQP